MVYSESIAVLRYSDMAQEIAQKLRGLFPLENSRKLSPSYQKAYDVEISKYSAEDQEHYRVGSEHFLRRMKIVQYFSERVKFLDIDLIKSMSGGHNCCDILLGDQIRSKNGRSWWVKDIGSFIMLGTHWSIEQVRHIYGVIEGTIEPGEWVATGMFSLGCHECNSGWETETNGKTIRCVKGQECEYPLGLKEYSTYVNIPSGKMVVDDDLRDEFLVVDDDFNVNTRKGIMDASKAYELVGMGYGFCGNTCPSMYAHGRNKNKEKFSIGGTKGTRVAKISTDLWWYSVADYDEYLKRSGLEKIPEWGADLVDCKPGKYKIQHFGHFIDRDKGRPVYATFEWVGEADPPIAPKKTTIYYKSAMKDAGFITVKSIGTRQKAERHIVLGDEEGLLLTEEVYESENDAANSRNPISIAVLAVVENGKSTIAPTPELMVSMNATLLSHKECQVTMESVWKREQDERDAELTPDELKTAAEKRERENAPYQTDVYKANVKKAEDRFYQAVEMAKRGEDYHVVISERISFPPMHEDSKTEDSKTEDGLDGG